jgi:hypothetical protein
MFGGPPASIFFETPYIATVLLVRDHGPSESKCGGRGDGDRRAPFSKARLQPLCGESRTILYHTYVHTYSITLDECVRSTDGTQHLLLGGRSIRMAISQSGYLHLMPQNIASCRGEAFCICTFFSSFLAHNYKRVEGGHQKTLLLTMTCCLPLSRGLANKG